MLKLRLSTGTTLLEATIGCKDLPDAKLRQMGEATVELAAKWSTDAADVLTQAVEFTRRKLQACDGSKDNLIAE